MSTTKIALIVIVLSTISGAVWVTLASNGDEHFFCKWPHPASVGTIPAADKQAERKAIVFAMSDIPHGSIIPASALEERPSDSFGRPANSYWNTSLVAGRTARRDIKANSIVVFEDLNPRVGEEVGYHP